MTYLLTAIGFPLGGSSTVYIYTQIIHRTTQSKQYIEQHKNFGRVRVVPRLCVLYPGFCFTTEVKARKNLSQGSRRVPVGTMNIHEHTIRIHRHNNRKHIGKRIRGRPRKRWIVDIEEDMQIMGIRRWRKKCKERAEWKRITEKAKIHSGL